MAVFILLVPILLTVLYIYLSRNYDFFQKLGVQYEKPVPFLGNAKLMLFKQNIGPYLRSLYEKTNGPITGFFVLDKPILVVKDLEIIKNILVKDFQYFHNRVVASNLHDDPIGSQMLFMLQAPYSKVIRQKMTTAFTSGKMKLMFPLMTDVGKDMINYLHKQDEEIENVRDFAIKFTTDVITSCAFALKALSFEKEETEFRVMATQMFEFSWLRGIQTTCYFVAPALVKFFHMKFLDPYCANLMRDTFWNAVNIKKESGVKRHDVVEILMEIQESENPKDEIKLEGDIIVAQAAQFFLGGLETSGTTISFTLYELALHPEVQTRLRKEIFQVREKHGGITYDAVHDMKYLDMIVAEALRMHPPLPFLDRKAVVDYKIPGTDIILPKGTSIFLPMLGLHFDPNYFPDPERFNPDRFAPENKSAGLSCTFLAFGEGPRNCIGMRFGLLSTKLAVITILSEYEILPTKNTPDVMTYDPKSFMLEPSVPLALKFKKIQP